MFNKVFGEVEFDYGWRTEKEIIYKGEKYNVNICANSYDEADMITSEQENAFEEFKNSERLIISKIEEKMIFDGAENYYPVMLLFEENGDYGLVFDDKNNIEEGVVVTIKPQLEIVSTDQYF